MNNVVHSKFAIGVERPSVGIDRPEFCGTRRTGVGDVGGWLWRVRRRIEGVHSEVDQDVDSAVDRAGVWQVRLVDRLNDDRTGRLPRS